MEVGVQVSGVHLVKPLHVGVFPVERLHHPDAGDVLLEVGVYNGDGLPHPHEGPPRDPLPNDHDARQHRDDREGDERKLNVQQEHGDNNASKAEDVCQARDHQIQKLLQLVYIVLTTGHDAANFITVVERR